MLSSWYGYVTREYPLGRIESVFSSSWWPIIQILRLDLTFLFSFFLYRNTLEPTQTQTSSSKTYVTV